MKGKPFFVGVLLATAVLFGKDKTTIRVEVKNQFERPVENAAVILDFLGNRQIQKLGFRKNMHWEVRTNQEGRAHFPPIPQGTIQLQVITQKYQTYGEKIDIDTPERTVLVSLKPPQSQYSAHAPLKPKDPEPPRPEPPQ